MLALALNGVRFSEQDWAAWSAEGGCVHVPLFAERQELAERLAGSGSGDHHHKSTYFVQKKPAHKRPAGTVQVSKVKVVRQQHKSVGRRTPFTLKRKCL